MQRDRLAIKRIRGSRFHHEPQQARTIITKNSLLSRSSKFAKHQIVPEIIINEPRETNTQNVLNAKSSVLLMRPGVDTMYQLPSLSPAKHDSEDEALTAGRKNVRFKVSPTRIRLSTAAARLPAVENRISLGRGHLSKDHDNLLSRAIDYSNLRSKRVRQMAPAYEIWPEAPGNVNLAVSSAQQVANKKEVPVADSYLVGPKEVLKCITQVSRSYSSAHSLCQSNLRNLLPKPLPFLSSSTSNRVVRVRSTRNSDGTETRNSDGTETRKPKTDSAGNEEEDEPADEPNTGEESGVETDGDSPVLNEVDSAVAQDTDPDSNVDAPKSPVFNTNHANFKVFDSKQALARAENRRLLPESPVYPPGDLERLYSDALLVYVKDFNQYIKK